MLLRLCLSIKTNATLDNLWPLSTKLLIRNFELVLIRTWEKRVSSCVADTCRENNFSHPALAAGKVKQLLTPKFGQNGRKSMMLE